MDVTLPRLERGRFENFRRPIVGLLDNLPRHGWLTNRKTREMRLAAA
jgi:hypothetical protein